MTNEYAAIEGLPLTTYTVVGVTPETKERRADVIEAVSPRMAEDLARQAIQAQGGVLWVAGVYEGALEALDTYGTFCDDPDRVTAIEQVEGES